ncbi:MAG: glycosyltransferase family 39 protein [Rudaea sp.]
MTSIASERTTGAAAARAWPKLNEKTWGWIGLGAVVLLAALLRFANLDALGYANHYYTAAVKAMLQSWHNFFFVAAEPGGSVSIDKPPVGLWIQAISAFFLGVNGLGVLLPEILAGLLSVVVVYHLVRRSFGTAAGLIAALVLAITPVAVATDRNNTMDSILILTLLLAAWAFIKATETSKLRWLLVGAALVGVGFNIKMLEAYLPLPAFLALYFFGSKDRILPKVGKLAAAGAVLFVVSLSWATIVDLTPADQRPYVGSSTTNSELDLALGYNGAMRLLGMGGRGSLLTGILNGSSSGNLNRGFTGRTGGFAPPGGTGGFQPPQDGGGRFGAQPRGGPGGGNGFFNTGQAGPLRMFVAPLSNQMSWLLPFTLFSGLLLAFRSRIRWPLAPRHRAIVLWGGWLATGVVFFSVAGFFHEYYLSILAPAAAALAGIGVVEAWGLRKKHAWLAASLMLAAVAVTLAFEYYTAASFIRSVWWLPLMLALFLIGAVLLISAGRSKANAVAGIGVACLVAALLLTPGIWSVLTSTNASSNQTLPAAYNGGEASFGPAGRGGAGTQLTGLSLDQNLLAYLEANTQGVKYLMAVPSSMQGADYVIATGRAVLYMGGFGGQDQVVTAQDLARLVANGELRFVYVEGRGGFGGFGGGSRSDISSWVTSSCKPVQGYDAATANQGAPDGIGTSPTDGRGGFGFGSMRVSLYDCGS